MLEQLKQYLTYVSHNSSHWIFRCPFCGDSRDKSHGHLYVAKDKPVFRCVRCGTAGHYTYLFATVNATDIVIPESISSGSSSKRIHKKQDVSVRHYNYEDVLVNYINERLGIVDIPEELNIIPIEEYQRLVKNMADYSNFNYPLYNECVPVLSHKGHRIHVRVINNKNVRYYGYSLVKSPDCYIIGNSRSYSKYKTHNTVVFAEGSFDIMNQYIHRFVDTPNDAVYAASLTHNFDAAARIVRSVSFTYKPNLIVLADNDTKDEYYLNKMRYSSVKIYRNKNGKDFGEQSVEALLSYQK